MRLQSILRKDFFNNMQTHAYMKLNRIPNPTDNIHFYIWPNTQLTLPSKKCSFNFCHHTSPHANVYSFNRLHLTCSVNTTTFGMIKFYFRIFLGLRNEGLLTIPLLQERWRQDQIFQDCCQDKSNRNYFNSFQEILELI